MGYRLAMSTTYMNFLLETIHLIGSCHTIDFGRVVPQLSTEIVHVSNSSGWIKLCMWHTHQHIDFANGSWKLYSTFPAHSN